MSGANIVLKARSPGRDVVFALSEGENVIGRDIAAEITVPDARVSRRHARIAFEGDRFILEDLESSNGTFVNDQRCERAALADGDEIRVGDATLVFQDSSGHATKGSIPLTDEPMSTIILSERFDAEKSLEAIRSQPAVKSVAYLEFLYRVADSLNSMQPPDELVGKVLDGLMDAMDPDRAAVLLTAFSGAPPVSHDVAAPKTGDASGEAWFSEMHGFFVARLRGQVARTAFPLNMALANHVRAGRKGVIVEAPGSDARFLDGRPRHKTVVHSAVCVPLRAGEEDLGLLYADLLSPRKHFKDIDLHLLSAMAVLLGGFVQRQLRAEAMESKYRTLVREIKAEHNIVGNSKAIMRVFEFISRAAAVDSSVLIAGESGTGKELVARAVHFSGNRKDGPFVVVNCGALPDTLLESELFGHEKGAFTGAASRKPGKFELADRGAIFLDEIGEMSAAAQTRLLRVVEHGSFERLGGTVPVEVNVRVVAATNRSLQKAIAAGQFREDLFYRLNVLAVQLPPLRERREDIPLIARHLLGELRKSGKACVRDISPEALDKLANYHWPGNVRELRNAVERAAIMCEGDRIEISDLPLEVRTLAQGTEEGAIMALNELERKQIEKALHMTDWNKSRAAAILGIDRTTLYDKIRKYGLQHRKDAE